jgi:putative Holliday junction resolvase
MGLDVGEVRTGVALSDPLGIIAQAHSVIDASSPQDAVETICQLVDDQGVVQVVVGLPLNQHGEPGPQAQKVLTFVELLRSKLSIDVCTIDERFTTAGVQRSLIAAGVKRKGRKKVIDKLAAQQILQTYMDRRGRLQPRQDG